MTFDRAIRALLNGKAIRKKGNKWIRIGESETHHWLEGPSGYLCSMLKADIDWITSDEWECGTYNPKTNTVKWDNVVYDGHDRPIDRLPNTAMRIKGEPEDEKGASSIT